MGLGGGVGGDARKCVRDSSVGAKQTILSIWPCSDGVNPLVTTACEGRWSYNGVNSHSWHLPRWFKICLDSGLKWAGSLILNGVAVKGKEM